MVNFVEASAGQWKLLSQASNGCQFIDIDIETEVDAVATGCPERKRNAVDYINRLRPDVVLISNHYGRMVKRGTDEKLSDREYEAAMRRIVDQFSASTGRVAFLSAPPEGQSPDTCYRPDGSPADCISTVGNDYFFHLNTERAVAESLPNGEVIDAHLLFCTTSDYCPMFAGDTPMKRDTRHISPAYANFMTPAFIELLHGTTAFAERG